MKIKNNPLGINKFVFSLGITLIALIVQPFSAMAAPVFSFQFSNNLNSPYAVAHDASGNIYVADQGNTAIEKFDSSGVYQSQFGSSGTGDGEFLNPVGIVFDGSGNIYVLDYGDASHARVQKFDSSGVYQSQFGSFGSGDGDFEFPQGIAIDAFGNIYVADSNNYRVEKFDSSGVYQSQFGSHGTGNGQFGGPSAITIDALGNIYVVDPFNNNVQKFDSNGNFILSFGWGVDTGASQFQICPAIHSCHVGSFGSGNGQFNTPYGMTFDNTLGHPYSGDIYVVDTFNSRVQIFDTSGNYVGKFGSHGFGAGQFIQPLGATIISSGDIYVTDNANSVVEVFNPVGTAPTVTSINPTSGTTAGGTSVSISGTNFVSGATVAIGGTAATNVVFVDSGHLTATTAAHAAGTVDVVVTNPDTQTGTLSSGYTYVSPSPTVTSINPTSGTTAGGTSVSISGTNFVSGATVAIGGTAATNVVFVDSGHLTATTGAHAAGTVNVVVTNPDTQTGTLSSGYTYVSPSPVTSGSSGGGGNVGGSGGGCYACVNLGNPPPSSAPTTQQSGAPSFPGYKDLLTTDPDYAAFQYLYGKGIITGNPDGTVNPNGNVQRDQTAKIILKAFQPVFNETTDYCNKVGPFPDVLLSNWAANYVCYSVQHSIITGYLGGIDKGYFRPGRTVNWAEFAVLVTRNIHEVIPSNSSSSYPNVPTNQWFSGAAAYFKNNELTNVFALNQPMTRRQVAEILYKLHQLGKL